MRFTAVTETAGIVHDHTPIEPRFDKGDTIIRDPGVPVLLRNDTNNGYHWLKVTLEGSNRCTEMV